jgi:hypothetical protein
MTEEHKETCFSCEKKSTCVHRRTLEEFMHPVPCVFYQRESIQERVDHPRHTVKWGSTEYAHMNGLSRIGWCTRCGAECTTGQSSHSCYSFRVVKTFREGGLYKKKGISGKKYSDI